MIISNVDTQAMSRLLTSPIGPVGLAVQLRAAATVAFARRNVGIITERVPFSVEQDVDSLTLPDGSVVIGIRDTGRVTQYLAKKADRERESWLIPALSEAFSRISG